MKKTLIITTALVATLFGIGFANASATNKYLNENGIQINQNQYDKLISVGYTDKEIEKISKEKFDKVMNMNIIYQNIDTKYAYFTEINTSGNKRINR